MNDFNRLMEEFKMNKRQLNTLDNEMFENLFNDTDDNNYEKSLDNDNNIIEYDLNVDLEDFYTGKKKKLNVNTICKK
jgi:DnaJ-class molecular chaperone